jgi:hypothetical protein
MTDTGSWTIVADNRLGQVARKQVAFKVHPNQMPIEVSKNRGFKTKSNLCKGYGGVLKS